MQSDISKQITHSFSEIAKEKGIDRDMLLFYTGGCIPFYDQKKNTTAMKLLR